MAGYVPTIGLEIHAQLKTRTKMFCDSKNDPDERQPNVNICPVCLAHPGTLPTINREAVAHVLRVGIALGGKLAHYTEFDRKNYFYPDLPKGYQISQYEYPLVRGGELNGVKITRIHLEEDTASSLHDESVGVTMIDYNRAGIPLMELVTEPVIKSSAEAAAFARDLQLLLRTLGVSEANMEKGEMRVEANVSIAPEGGRGIKVEIKNLNSFRAMERAIEHEIRRQQTLLERGERIAQETRGWDESRQATFSQRTKEESADYRYFPDPDLPSLSISRIEEFVSLERTMPELPWQRRARYRALGIREEDAELFVREGALGMFFDSVSRCLGNRKELIHLAANYIANDLVKILRDRQKRETQYSTDIGISPENFASLMQMLALQQLSSRAAKDILIECVGTNLEPKKVAQEKGLFQIDKFLELQQIVDSIIAKHPDVVDDFQSGKEAALQYLVGQGMKEARGAANPRALRDMFLKKIGSTR